MKRLLTLFLLLGASLCFLTLPALADAIPVDEFRNTDIDLGFKPIQGGVVLCETGLNMVNGKVVGCKDGKVSDIVVFSLDGERGCVNKGKGCASMFSDSEDRKESRVDDSDVVSGMFGDVFKKGQAIEDRTESAEGTVQTIAYAAKGSLPGADSANPNKTVNYSLTSDVPEPATLLLLSAGLVGLAGVARRRARHA